MKTYLKNGIKSKKLLAFLIIALVIVAAYGLVLFQVFSLRNDIVRYFLPVRMCMSDAFNHHEFLLWNPYVSGSYPMHSDMQAPVWNPIVVALSWLFNYNITLLSFEVLLYYTIGAVGCFCFARNFSKNFYSCITIAVCYMCSGFAASILEYMSWVGSFAFIPWVACYFYQLLTKRNFTTALKLAVSVWLLLVCGYPSFFIMLGYACFISLVIYCVRLYATKRAAAIWPLVKYSLIAVLFFTLLALPAIHSFIEYLPFYARGKHAALEHINSEFFTLAYPYSFIFPGSLLSIITIENSGYWQYDTYIGLIPFILLCLRFDNLRTFKFQDCFLLILTILLCLFTVGRSAPLRLWCAKYLPFMDAFGFSHSARIFIILALLILIIPKLDQLYQKPTARLIKNVKYIAAVLVLLLAFYGAKSFYQGGFAYHFSQPFFWVGFAFQFVLFGIIIFVPMRFFKQRWLFSFILLDMVASVNLVIPITGLSKTPPSVMNTEAARFYTNNMSGYLMNPLLRIKELQHFEEIKTINIIKLIPTYGAASNTRSEAYFNYVLDTTRFNKLAALPFAFASNQTKLQVDSIELGYNQININIVAQDSCKLVLQQTYHPRWRSKQPDHVVSAYNNILLQTQLTKGVNRIHLFYYHNDLLAEAIISLLCLLYIGIQLFYFRYRD